MVTLDLLQNQPIFAMLNEEQIKFLSSKAEVLDIPRKKRLFNHGDPIDYFYVVQKGSIKLGTDIDKEKTIIKHIAYENDIFGENIFMMERRNEFAEAVKKSSVIKIRVDVIKQLLIDNHSFANKITEVIIERINVLEQRMKNFIFMKAHHRIALFLKQTAQSRGIKIGMDEILINHGMSHKDISFLTDTSRQTVTRVLSEFKSLDFIHFSPRKPSKILIRNLAALPVA